MIIHVQLITVGVRAFDPLYPARPHGAGFDPLLLQAIKMSEPQNDIPVLTEEIVMLL